MIRIVILFMSLILSVVYLLFPNTGEVHFPFIDMVITVQMWVWMFAEHVAAGSILIAVYVLITEKKYRLCAWTFFAIHVVDTIDFALTYSEPWGTNKVVTFNTMKCVVFLIAMVLDFGKHAGDTERN